MSRTSPLRRRLLAASSLMLLGTPGARAQSTPGVLRAIPDEAPTELARKAAPLMTYLGEKLGLKAEFTPVTDYAGAVEAIVSRKLDLAWFGGFTFVQANVRSGGKWISDRFVSACFLRPHSRWSGTRTDLEW